MLCSDIEIGYKKTLTTLISVKIDYIHMSTMEQNLDLPRETLEPARMGIGEVKEKRYASDDIHLRELCRYQHRNLTNKELCAIIHTVNELIYKTT